MLEIERNLCGVLQTIRVIRNIHIPVNQLPPEVLSKILEHRDCEEDLVAATHVCRYWRSTLTSNPSLWTHFRFMSPRDVDRSITCLERSKSVPIDIEMDIIPSLEVLQHFAPHISRTRSFSIQGYEVHIASSLLLCNPAPFLEYLEMRTYGGLEDKLYNFLGGQAPSLRSLIFEDTFPVLEFPFPLPNLTEFNLILSDDAGTFHISSLLRFLSGCPQLRKISFRTACWMLEDVTSNQVIPLEFLAELSYTCDTVCQVLPFLQLPRINRLQVTSLLQPGSVDKLADILPHGGRIPLLGATKMSFSSAAYSQTVHFPGEEAEVLITGKRSGENPTPIDWFSDGTCIPSDQIQDLKVEGRLIGTGFSFSLFKNLTTFRTATWEVLDTDGFLRPLYPETGTAVACPSLREVHCTCWSHPGSLARSLLSLAKERKRAGYQLELVRLLSSEGLVQDLTDQLKEHVGELQVGSLAERA